MILFYSDVQNSGGQPAAKFLVASPRRCCRIRLSHWAIIDILLICSSGHFFNGSATSLPLSQSPPQTSFGTTIEFDIGQNFLLEI